MNNEELALRAQQGDKAAQEELFSVECNVDNENLKVALSKLLLSCTESQRNVILLKYYSGKSFNEIGQFIGMNQEGVRKEEIKALRKLRSVKCLETLRPFIEAV